MFETESFTERARSFYERACDVMGIKEDPPDPFDEIQEMHENYVSRPIELLHGKSTFMACVNSKVI